jgi:sulfur carrier protein ThiS
LARPLGAALVLRRGLGVRIGLRTSSQLAGFLPPSGGIELREGAKVRDLLKGIELDSDLVMLIVIDGELADIDSPLSDGMTVELIPPISGG